VSAAEFLDALDQAHAAATPGPWQVDNDGDDLAVTAGTARGLPGSWRATDRIFTSDVGEWSGEEEHESEQRKADAATIVAEHNATPRLVAAVRAVLEVAGDLDRDADYYSLAAVGSHDHGVHEAQSDAADRIRTAVGAALGVETGAGR
jgi:hypothetical protein